MITKAELLGMSPAQLVGWVFPGGSGSEHWGTASLALSEQVRSVGVEIAALELCLVGLHNVAECADQERMMAPARELLARQVEMQARGVPVLYDWMVAIRDVVVKRWDVDVAIELLGRAHSTWSTLQAFEAQPKPEYGE